MEVKLENLPGLTVNKAALGRMDTLIRHIHRPGKHVGWFGYNLKAKTKTEK